MKVASLEAHGAHPELLAAWMKHYTAELLPIQERAVLEGCVLQGASIVGSGPTGCGKTFIAEMAATHAACQGRRIFYLVPTKSLAEAKYAEFAQTYCPLGLRVDIATRDRRSADARLVRGDFDIAVTVPEKLWSLVLKGPALVHSVGALVVDELQLIGDPDRGPCLELVLSRFLHSGVTQVVGLSAVLGNDQELADWLGARLVRESRRPVELRKGVWRAGRFSYMEHNTQTTSWEDLAGPDDDELPPLAAMVRLAVGLAAQGEPTLVFLRDRKSSSQAAGAAAELLGASPAGGVTEALSELPRTQSTTRLLEYTQSGVAYHNADLQFAERRAIEEGFARGQIRCLFCTTTLAVGVNLPARNVIVEPLKWRSTERGAATLTPLSQAEFENMAGRAGRPGYGDAFGRAILLGTSEFAADGLTRRYIRARPERVEGQLGGVAALRRLVLRAIMREEVGEAGAEPRLFSALGPDAQPEGVAELAIGAGLVAVSPIDGRLGVTGVGRALAASGLSMETVGALTTTTRGLKGAPTNLEALIMACLSLEARRVPLPRAHSEEHWLPVFQQKAQAMWGWSATAQEIFQAASLRASDRQHAARVAATVLEWTGHGSSAELELATGLSAGRAMALCEAVGWVVQCIAQLVAELGCTEQEFGRLRSFGESVSAGVPEECLGLRAVHLPGLQRDHALALAAAGITCREQLLAAPQDNLRPVLPASVCEQIKLVASVHDPSQRRTTPAPEPVGQRDAVDGPLLVVDSGRPDIALVNGREVSLRPMEFRLLMLLAKTPRRCVNVDYLYDELWGCANAVEPQQIYWHKHKLVEKLKLVMPDDARPLVKTLPRHGLMLDVPPERVQAA